MTYLALTICWWLVIIIIIGELIVGWRDVAHPNVKADLGDVETDT